MVDKLHISPRTRPDRIFNHKQVKHEYLALRCRFAWLLMALLTLTLANCSTSNTVVPGDPMADHSFLTQQPCAAPCWYDLEPDQASKEDVYRTLRGLNFVNQSTIRELSASWLEDNEAKEIAWDCIHPNKRDCGSATVSLDKLKRVRMVIGYPLTFAQAVNQLGPPDFVDYGISHDGQCTIGLNWPLKNISVQGYDVRMCRTLLEEKSVKAETQIETLDYSLPWRDGTCCRVPWTNLTIR